MENIIEVKNLTKSYKNKIAVDNLTFNVKKGEILGLLGPNGSGKTTTINSILSLLNYDKGLIKIYGKEMNPDAYDIKEKIGVIFQEVAVFEELTVYDNIDYFCGLYITDKENIKTNIVIKTSDTLNIELFDTTNSININDISDKDMNNILNNILNNDAVKSILNNKEVANYIKEKNA